LRPAAGIQADLAARCLHQEGLERPPFLGNEARQQVGSPRGEQLLNLRLLDRLLQDDPAGAEIATALRPHRLLADVRHAMLEHAGVAFRAGAEALLLAEIRRCLVS
jgi:hypothetical protein